MAELAEALLNSLVQSIDFWFKPEWALKSWKRKPTKENTNHAMLYIEKYYESVLCSIICFDQQTNPIPSMYGIFTY